jgi:hypothetical protein
MKLTELEKLMVEYGLAIRAIPHKQPFCLEVRHRAKFPTGIKCYDARYGRIMLKGSVKNKHGGKFVVTVEHSEGAAINYWGKPNEKYKGKPAVFYDSIEEAVAAVVESYEAMQGDTA